MKKLATYNIKGGVGKTAAAVNISYVAACQGYRTLVWDLDPQGSASFYFRIKPKIKGGSKALIHKNKALDDVVKGTDFENLDLIPADFSYRNLDLELVDTNKPLKQLLRLMRPVSEQYDLLVLDCAPSISMVSENVFYAADALLVPLIPTTLSVQTYERLISHLDQVSPNGMKTLPFFSMVDCRKRLHQDIVETLPREHPDVLKTMIPYASQVELMGIHRAPVGSFAPNSPSAEAYWRLWDEVRHRI